MNHIPSASTSSRRIRREYTIVFILLLIPLAAVSIMLFPRYYSYSAPGDIVSVQDIGVNGSVNFCYVQEGVTTNLYERFAVGQALPNAKFERADADAQEALESDMQLGEELRDETIGNAIRSADEQDADTSPEEDYEDKYASLTEETANYYGDSIGLMLGIGLVEEEQHLDFSKNGKYVIAGTGTLEEDHSVGSVGAIPNKVQTAVNAKATIFFVPKDKENWFYEGLSNEEEAMGIASSIPSVHIVPVATLEEALDYLRQLK
ncbi:hypothetical protein A8990_16617 [Paenibacillus taihuensis]|uniref:PDZ domain-containing protein n=1 Tax=Paenibacillus taihuensis TaxID=1156355 RepID=A0A3D9Q1I9_9BACL|nr:hypothetical protein [Paenibacillus taihuensis]REE56280.1 hypothetical protein A8990_16617 [Paenibacillus taihuensis]